MVVEEEVDATGEFRGTAAAGAGRRVVLLGTEVLEVEVVVVVEEDEEATGEFRATAEAEFEAAPAELSDSRDTAAGFVSLCCGCVSLYIRAKPTRNS